jgi:hypothetical protein
MITERTAMAKVYYLPPKDARAEEKQEGKRRKKRRRGNTPITLGDFTNLKEAMEIINEAYGAFADFAREAIDPAIREMFCLFAQTMVLEASAIRDKMGGEKEEEER